ncbi:MAG: segregation/condensation protein A [Desulfobacterales bacterium]|jgi:segregation and condensation protein A|nr:segregation/condensation protein A [Desulfobacteraceae bacterium]MBT4364391.1 segregation/condensation protein A [Desulfobacteraceae bacterium]MBT7085713.1 segregation/condensation protein A [Desulfobacterales bacterium]MBT7696248.1 segregation/condensation protein A [Desulfobacterales bacterium]
MSNEIYKIKMDVFEGPMDLLIHLIRKAEVDIYDIPIALITSKFLSYIDWMKKMNIDFAGDFLVMAATLTQIKSKMLLPVHEGDEDEDPRMEIIRPLDEYLHMKSVAEQLYQRNLLGQDTFIRKSDNKDFLPHDGDEIIQVGLFDLIDAFQKILDKIPAEHKIDLTSDRISVQDRISEIVNILEEQGSVIFTEIFSDNCTKNEIIVTFLAILEMIKLSLIQAVQHIQTGIIRIFYL